MNDKLCAAVNAFQYLLTAVQVEQVLRFVSLGLSIFSTLVILCFKLSDWFKRAKADKKIDKQEIEELKDILEDSKNKIKQEIDKHE